MTPGVYLYSDASGRVVYVGKAKVLRRRVASYFRDEARHTPKTRTMLRHAVSIKTLSTTTEKEALLLEASLIKKHRPRYNILLRDDKQYVLFKLTKRHEWPRLTLTRRVQRDGSVYFGPFSSAFAARETWKIIHRVFPLRRCTDSAFRNRVRPCLYHFMGQCPAPCVLEADSAAYKDMVSRVEMLLSGRSTELLDMLRAEMLAASDALNFEKAAALRDQLRAVEATVERQVVVLSGAQDVDILGVAESEDGVSLGILFVRQSTLLDKNTFFWSGLTLDDAPELLVSFLSQYYSAGTFVPPRIIVPWDSLPRLEQDDAAGEAHASVSTASDIPSNISSEHSSKYSSGSADAPSSFDDIAALLSELCGAPVRIHSPRNATEEQLVGMATDNARLAASKKQRVDIAAILAQRLHLDAPPVRIEAVDVSHTSGKQTRVGVVVFENGAPLKSHYKTYAFTDEEAGGDDTGTLALWAKRRIASGAPWPDLLLIDGGRGQLHAVMRSLQEEGADTLFAVASIAKARMEDDDSSGYARGQQSNAQNTYAITHRPDRRAGNVSDRIFLPERSNPVNIKAGSPELLFLQHVRDSVHDYSIGKHRKARAGAALSAELLRLPGIGMATAKLLWEHFDSLQAMHAAGEKGIAQIPSIGAKKAAVIYNGIARLVAEKEK